MSSDPQGRPRPGSVSAFLTDATLCIGCKACEVACKEWNRLPDDGFEWAGLSYDHGRGLGASTYRHVKFLERDLPLGTQLTDAEEPFRWVFVSDVCKHCREAGCLEACPTGSIVRTEFESVYVQPDVCNGCGYCVVTCPFGVIDRRPDDGRAFKCTFCYDRQRAGEIPACAKACPTDAILFGEREDMRRAGEARVLDLRDAGVPEARLWDGEDGAVDGAHALFVLVDEPEAVGIPPRPAVPVERLRAAWTSALLCAAGLFVVVMVALWLP